MGTLNFGPYGHLNGKNGKLVWYTLNGQNVSRMIGSRTKPLTPNELASCQRMEVLNHFLSNITPVLTMGFSGAVQGTRQNYYNAAVSYNIRHAMKGEYPDIALDYHKVLVASGHLPPALNAAFTLQPNGVSFTWDIQPGLEYRYLGNRTMILLYFPSGIDHSGRPYAVWELSGARRSECADFISLDAACIGKPFEAYMAFRGLRDEVSDSVWIA